METVSDTRDMFNMQEKDLSEPHCADSSVEQRRTVGQEPLAHIQTISRTTERISIEMRTTTVIDGVLQHTTR